MSTHAIAAVASAVVGCPRGSIGVMSILTAASEGSSVAEAIGHLVADAEGIPADQLDLSVATSQEVHQ